MVRPFLFGSSFLFLLAPGARSQSTIRVSVDSTGVQGNQASSRPSLSNGGLYSAFESASSNLAANDTNGGYDVFRHNRQSGVTVLVSVNVGGVSGQAGAFDPDITPDGRYVAFWSTANDLVFADTSGNDVFVRDMTASATTLLSRSTSGVQGNFGGYYAAISDDGRYVTFASDSTNLVTGDTNAATDVFVRDRTLNTTVRASVDSTGVQGNGYSANQLGRNIAISGNGRFVAFTSDASNLVAGDVNGGSDVFVHDLQTATTICASVTMAGLPGGAAFDPSLSYDGSRVAFSSLASGLVPNDTNGGTRDVFVRNLVTGVTVLANLTNGGVQAGGFAYHASISNDGRYVAFRTTSVLAPGDGNTADIYVRDLLTGCTFLESVSSTGGAAGGTCDYPAISPDGGYVGFDSVGPALVGGDTNGREDVFVRERGALPIWTPFCLGDGQGPACPCGNTSFPGNGEGCASSLGYGAKLKAMGNPDYVTDTFVLLGSQMPNSTALYFQGNTSISSGFFLGDGVVCVANNVIRLGQKQNVGGASMYPETGDQLVSVKGMITGAFTRYYQIWYRNAATFCTTDTYNLSNAIGLTWTPCVICP